MLNKALLLIWLLFSIACQSNRQFANTQSERPNIVWLVSEDNSKHYLQLYDSTGVPMSSLQRLRERGLVFNHAFSNAPVCSVARSTIISGCYAPRIGTQYHRCIQKVPLPGNQKMFPYYLQKAGYYTSNNAKEDYNIIKGDSVWHESSRDATYQNRPKNMPFFHVQNFGITHEGQLHFSADEVAAEPNETDLKLIQPFPYHPVTNASKYTYAKLHDQHRKLDAQLNKFLDQLEVSGLMDDTFIFYYGDHGGVLPRSKGYVYESGLHVPLVVYVPEKFKHLVPVEPGNRVNGFVSFIDLAPSVLALAGIEVPLEMDGIPFLGPTVSSAALESRQLAFGHADRFDEKYDLVRTMRKGHLKYMRSYQPFNVDALHNFYRYRMLMFDEWRSLNRQGKLNDVQAQFFQPRTAEALYDLNADPHEINNVANNQNYAGQLKEMRKLLQEKVKALPDLSFYPEPYFLTHGAQDPVKFGQQRKEEIAALVDIADLALKSFADARVDIENNLLSDNAWKRYWALITCSVFGDEASQFISLAKDLAESDNSALVRIRALEFLTLNGINMPRGRFHETLAMASSMAEANLILNSLALLYEVVPDFSIPELGRSIPRALIEEAGSLVPHRLEYLMNIGTPARE